MESCVKFPKWILLTFLGISNQDSEITSSTPHPGEGLPDWAAGSWIQDNFDSTVFLIFQLSISQTHSGEKCNKHFEAVFENPGKLCLQKFHNCLALDCSRCQCPPTCWHLPSTTFHRCLDRTMSLFGPRRCHHHHNLFTPHFQLIFDSEPCHTCTSLREYFLFSKA